MIQDGRCNPGHLPSYSTVARVSFGEGQPFRAAPSYRRLVSGSFHPSRGAFQLSLTVLVRYRSRDVFRVGSRCLPASRRISDRRYSGTPQELGGLRLRGFHPLRRRVPADFGFAPRAPPRALQHHIPRTFRPGVQFALCRFRSPLLTASLLLSFPAGTKMFQFPAFPLPTGSAAKAAGGPIRASPVRRLPAPRRGLSQLATPFVGAPSRAIHQAA